MRKKVFIILLILFVFFLNTPSCFAWSFKDTAGFITSSAGEAGLSQKDPTVIVANVISTLLLMTGTIFVILFIYGGFMWMTAAGADEKISKARKILTYSTISLVIIVSAYTIANFIASSIPAGAPPTLPTTPGATTTTTTTPGTTPTTGTGSECATAGGACASYDYCTGPDVQGTPLGIKGCVTQICCKMPDFLQKCRDCGKASVNICDETDCQLRGCNCKFRFPNFCDYQAGYQNNGPKCNL